MVASGCGEMGMWSYCFMDTVLIEENEILKVDGVGGVCTTT